LRDLPSNEPGDCGTDDGNCNYYCGKQRQPGFHTISENEPYSVGNRPYDWVTGVFAAPQKNATNIVYGYPCSTTTEDNCCRDKGNEPAWYDDEDTTNGTPPGNCNRYGLTAYRRRIIKEYYPWTWEVYFLQRR